MQHTPKSIPIPTFGKYVENKGMTKQRRKHTKSLEMPLPSTSADFSWRKQKPEFQYQNLAG